MDSDDKAAAIFVVCLCIVMVTIALSGPIGSWLNHDIIVLEKQIELEKLKQKNNQVKAVKENDIQGQDKNKQADSKSGL